VADPAAGVSPLQDGILINAPEDTTPGNMRADVSAAADNVATITFDVVVASNVIESTIISNQAQVTGNGIGSGPFPSQVSDDPATDVFGDPTQDIVGNLPILDIQKTAILFNDVAANDDVDNGDTLRYTFRISNAGNIAASGVRLNDAVPDNSTYVANSVTLNGAPVADTIPGTSPLIAGIDISSPAAAAGLVSAGQSATVSFDVLVATRTDGKAPPAVAGANCWGNEKVRRLRQETFFSEVDWSESFAYSDHVSDAPLLELCGHPLAVNPRD